MCFYQEKRPECRIVSFLISGSQRKIDCFNADGYFDHCKTVFKENRKLLTLLSVTKDLSLLNLYWEKRDIL